MGPAAGGEGRPGGSLFLEQPDELGGRNPELAGGGGRVSLCSGELIKSLRKQRWVIVMLGAHRDPPAAASRLPERRRTDRAGGHSVLDGQAKPQTPEGHAAVFRLRATFRRFGGGPRGQVREHHGRLGLVAVLSPRAGSFRAGLPAGGEQGSGIEGGRVHHDSKSHRGEGSFGSDRFYQHNRVSAPVAQVDRAWDF